MEGMRATVPPALRPLRQSVPLRFTLCHLPRCASLAWEEKDSTGLFLLPRERSETGEVARRWSVAEAT